MNSTRLRAIFEKPSATIVFVCSAIIVFFFYHPVLGGFFISDDNFFVARLLDLSQYLLRGEKLGDWFFGFNGVVFLRPILQWLFLFNFMTWGTNATGYYLINIVLHALNAFLVYLLTMQITRSRWGAVAAAVLFALHPIHAESVSWIVDCVDLLAAFFCLLSAIYFALFRQKNSRFYFVVSLLSFALAALTKESTLTLPAIFLVYDLLFTWRALRWNILKAQLPIWCMLPGYVALRFLLFGKFGGYGDQSFLRFGWELFIQYYTLVFVKPFLADIDFLSLALVLALAIVLVALFRQSKALWLGVVWIIALLIPAGSANYVAPRLAYIPSVGLALAQGALFGVLFSKRATVWRGLTIGALALFGVAYGWSLAGRVDDWATVGSATRAVVEKTRALHPSFPPSAHLYYIGIPEYLRGIDLYASTFASAFRIAYPDTPSLSADAEDKFPIVADRLEQNFFFEFRRREVIEHPEVRQLLLTRQQCSGVSSPAIEWNFLRDAQGWEPWNQIADWRAQDGALTMRAEGNDPFLGSPAIDIPALSLGEIEITMRVRADQPILQGQVYWLAAGASDFSPDLKQAFQAQADDEFHTYRVDLAATGWLSIEDRLVRLRLDPVNAPAEIAIKTIRVMSHCVRSNENSCQCK